MARWQKLCIEKMLATGLAEITLVIVDDMRNYAGRTFIQKLKAIGFSRALFMLYMRSLYRPRSLQAEDAGPLLEGVPAISCVVEKKGRYSQYFSPADVERIRSHELDIILRFGFNIIRGDILQAARYGVWSFHHGDEMKYRGGPPCFWEIYRQDPETGAVLQRLTERLDGGIVLKKGIFRTRGHSFPANLDQAYFESAKWPAWVCRDIVNGLALYLEATPTPTDAPIYRYPTNAQFLRAAMIMLANQFRRIFARLLVMQRWNVALIRGSPDALLAGTPPPPPSALLNLAGSDAFNADAFGAPLDRGAAVLFEELDYAAGGQGRIWLALLDENGKELARRQPDGLPTGSHMSYPFLFGDGGGTYMIPETGELGRVSLFRATRFPDQWAHAADLLTGAFFADTTLVKRDGLYWLFHSRIDAESDVDLHLHLAFSDRLQGPYSPHPGNPVKISARSARCAGTPFLDREGCLIRPAQNFCRTYGGSIVLNRVTTLTPQLFAEEEVAELRPFDPYYRDGVHTLAIIDEERYVVDMKRHVLRLPLTRILRSSLRLRQQ